MPPSHMRASDSSTSVEVARRRCVRMPGAPEQFEHHRLREFRRAAHAAMDRIDQPPSWLRRAVELGARRSRPWPSGCARLGEPRHQGAAVLLDARPAPRGKCARPRAARRRRPACRSARLSENRCRPRTARRRASGTWSAASRRARRGDAAPPCRSGRCRAAPRGRP